MRSLKSSLFTLAFSGMLGAGIIVGCAGTEEVDLTDTDTTDADSGVTTIPSTPEASTPDSSTPKKDAGTKDSGKDSGPIGPTGPNPGDACAQIGKEYTRKCGKCGEQMAVCEPGGDAGAGIVSAYGTCSGETGECTPGESVACGNCGTGTCTQYCSIPSGSACTGQPANSCVPGTVEYKSPGCAINTYKKWSCAAVGAPNQCTWEVGACAEPVNDIKLTIATTPNGVVTGTYEIQKTKLGGRPPTYTCPGAATATPDYPYEVVELFNSSTKKATIVIETTAYALKDLVMTAYAGNLPPADSDLGACVDTDEAFGTGSSAQGKIGAGTRLIELPAGGKSILRLTSYYAHTTTNVTSGSVSIKVTTTKLN